MPASVVITLPIATSSIRLHFKAVHSAVGTKLFKIMSEGPNSEIIVKNNTGSDHVREGEKKKRLSQERSARS